MDSVDLAYLALVIGAFALFAVVLAYTSAIAKERTHEKRQRTKRATAARPEAPFGAHPAD